MKSEKTKCLVTGSAGFIGYHLVEALLKAGIPVVGIDNLDPFYSIAVKRQNILDLENISKKTGTPFVFLERDLVELESSWLADFDIDCVIHLAAKAGVRPSLQNPEGYLHANVLATLRLLELCRDRGVNPCVYGSSSSVYGTDSPVPFKEDTRADHPISPYVASKRAGELYCYSFAHLYGIRIAALRLFTVYGPRQRPDLAIHKFCRAISDGSTITLFGDGSTSRDYTFVTDTVKGILGARDWVATAKAGSFEAFNLGGATGTTLKQLVQLIETALGKKAKVDWQPQQPGDVERTLADVTKSKNILGYSPTVRMEAGIPHFVQWFQGFKTQNLKAA